MGQNKVFKIITGVVCAVLLIITVVAVQQLFNSKLTVDLLKLQNDRLTNEQVELQKLINFNNDSIEFIYKDRIVIQKSRDKKKDVIIKINEEYEENIITIASDDVDADFKAIHSIFRQHTSSRD